MNEEKYNPVTDDKQTDAAPAAPAPQAKRYVALTRIENPSLGIVVEIGEVLPQALIDHSPTLLTHYDPPIVSEV